MRCSSFQCISSTFHTPAAGGLLRVSDAMIVSSVCQFSPLKSTKIVSERNYCASNRVSSSTKGKISAYFERYCLLRRWNLTHV